MSPLAASPAKRVADRFFILSQAEATECEASYRRAHPGDKGLIPGFAFSDAAPFEDQWEKLPG